MGHCTHLKIFQEALQQAKLLQIWARYFWARQGINFQLTMLVDMRWLHSVEYLLWWLAVITNGSTDAAKSTSYDQVYFKFSDPFLPPHIQCTWDGTKIDDEIAFNLFQLSKISKGLTCLKVEISMIYIHVKLSGVEKWRKKVGWVSFELDQPLHCFKTVKKCNLSWSWSLS